MRQYLDAIGILQIVFGALQLAAFALVLLPGLMYGGLGGLVAVAGIAEGDGEAAAAGAVIGGFGVLMMMPGVIILLLAAVSIAAGYGIVRRRKWGRILGIVAAALGMMQCFPLGLLVGIFAIIVLVQPDVGAEFDLHAAAAGD